jgi:hypothetical protein
MALTYQLALVADTPRVSPSDLNQVSAALQKQVTRDFGPIWGVQATVDVVPSLEETPLGYWPIIVRDDIHKPTSAGFHTDKRKQPYSLVQYTSTWSLTASHECLEMLADPFGNRTIAGTSPQDGKSRVEFLVEVADPCTDAKFSYTVNGVMVSDFCTPNFFEPVVAPGTRYSYSGAVSQPHQVLEGGYLSWHESVTNHWWQQTCVDGKSEFRDLGVIDTSTDSLRAMVDRMTIVPARLEGLPTDHPQLQAAIARMAEARQSTGARAAALRSEIEERLRRR